MIHFTCKTCGEQMEAPETMAGEILPCPGCGLSEKVPAADEYELKPTEETVSTQYGLIDEGDDEFVTFKCDCGEEISADLDQVGQPMQCPYCDKETNVPAPKPKEKGPTSPLLLEMTAWREPLGPDYYIRLHENELNCVPQRKGTKVLVPRESAKTHLKIQPGAQKLTARDTQNEKHTFKFTGDPNADELPARLPILYLYHMDAWQLNLSGDQAEMYVYDRYIKGSMSKLGVMAGIQFGLGIAIMIALIFTKGLFQLTITDVSVGIGLAALGAVMMIGMQQSWALLLLIVGNIACILGTAAIIALHYMGKLPDITLTTMSVALLGGYIVLLIVMLIQFIPGYLRIKSVKDYYGY